jgi:hypothetical protein
LNSSAALLAALVILAVGAAPAESQINVTGGVAYTNALEGQWGIDARLGLDPPMFPLGAFAGADYFPAECLERCSLWGWRVGLILHPAASALQPFLTGAYIGRERRLVDRTLQRTGLSLGVGFRVEFGLRMRAAVTREFLGEGLDQWIVRIGVGL